jgi:SAM-dependent methyltransferase
MWPLSIDYSQYGSPEVPAELIKYVCGTDSTDEFLRSGFEVVSMLNLACQKYSGTAISDFGSILDFGCGCGRLVRFIQPKGALFGCDVNRAVVDFCKTNFPRGSFHQNDLLPPLIYRDALFDLVYCFSVFSHLRQDIETAWLKELMRVGTKGCMYLITVQGDWMIEATLGSEAADAKEKGFYYKQVHQRHNVESDFPDYYEASYHTSDYIRECWREYFDVMAVIRGDSPERYLSDAVVIPTESTIPPLRPMGQDLVVAVKRD